MEEYHGQNCCRIVEDGGWRNIIHSTFLLTPLLASSLPCSPAPSSCNQCMKNTLSKEFSWETRHSAFDYHFSSGSSTSDSAYKDRQKKPNGGGGYTNKKKQKNQKSVIILLVLSQRMPDVCRKFVMSGANSLIWTDIRGELDDLDAPIAIVCHYFF